MPKLMMMPRQNERTRTWAKRLTEALPEYQVVLPENDAEAQREIGNTDAVFGWVPPEMLPGATNLRWLHSPAAGPQAGFYYPELAEHPVVISNPRGVYSDHIAQHIMMFVLGLARGLPYYVDAQRQGRWDKDARKSPYVDLGTATALIVGVGGIGHEAARLCAGFGMRVLAIDARWEYEVPDAEKHDPEDLDDLIPEADFVIAATPHTPQTEGMWNAHRFQLMKKTAYFINIGRGKTTRIDDLTHAIASGEIGGCGLDVYEEEPLPEGHKLWEFQNVLLTPHVASKDAENVPDRQFGVFLENARRFAAGDTLSNVVDKASWF